MKEASMRLRSITSLLFLVFLATLASRAQAFEDGYFRYPKGRLLFKLPAGTWEVVKQMPEPFDAFKLGSKPDVILAAMVRPAVILIWTDRSSTDYSGRLLKAYERLEKILKKRQRAAKGSEEYQYFDYDLLSGTPAAKSAMAAQTGDLQVKGFGEARIYSHEGSTYFHYFELLADADVFEAVSAEFIEALQQTRGY
jgi:hypothetical protein